MLIKDIFMLKINDDNEKKVLYILKKFKDKSISILVLIKLLYCCELKSISKNKKRFTTYDFKHYKFGPFVNLYDTVNTYCNLSIKENGDLDYNDLHNIKDIYKTVSISEFNKEDQEILNEVLEKWYNACSTGKFSGNTLDGLMNYVYMTPPLFETNYDEVIDLDSYIGQTIDKIYLTKAKLKSIDKKADKYSELFDEVSKVLQ